MPPRRSRGRGGGAAAAAPVGGVLSPATAQRPTVLPPPLSALGLFAESSARGIRAGLPSTPTHAPHLRSPTNVTRHPTVQRARVPSLGTLLPRHGRSGLRQACAGGLARGGRGRGGEGGGEGSRTGPHSRPLWKRRRQLCGAKRLPPSLRLPPPTRRTLHGQLNAAARQTLRRGTTDESPTREPLRRIGRLGTRARAVVVAAAAVWWAADGEGSFGRDQQHGRARRLLCGARSPLP